MFLEVNLEVVLKRVNEIRSFFSTEVFINVLVDVIESIFERTGSNITGPVAAIAGAGPALTFLHGAWVKTCFKRGTGASVCGKTVGLVAGDEDSWTLFKEIMEPVVSTRHGGDAADAVHPTNMDVSAVSTKQWSGLNIQKGTYPKFESIFTQN